VTRGRLPEGRFARPERGGGCRRGTPGYDRQIACCNTGIRGLKAEISYQMWRHHVCHVTTTSIRAVTAVNIRINCASETWPLLTTTDHQCPVQRPASPLIAMQYLSARQPLSQRYLVTAHQSHTSTGGTGAASIRYHYQQHRRMVVIDQLQSIVGSLQHSSYMNSQKTFTQNHAVIGCLLSDFQHSLMNKTFTDTLTDFKMPPQHGPH